MDLRGPDIDTVVWADLERFLRYPGDILEELRQEQEMDAGAAIVEAEWMTLDSAMDDLTRRRKRAINLNTRDRISDSELDELLEEIGKNRASVESRLGELRASQAEPEQPLEANLLEEVRRRLDDGLDDIQRQEVVRLLVKKITVYTEVGPKGKTARVLIEYRFPAVVNTSTDRGSWRPPT